MEKDNGASINDGSVCIWESPAYRNTYGEDEELRPETEDDIVKYDPAYAAGRGQRQS